MANSKGKDKFDLKSLIEKRNSVLDEGKKLAKVAETRSLKDDELGKLKEYRSQVEDINKTIDSVKEFRDLEQSASDEKDFTEKKVEPKDEEKDEKKKELRSKGGVYMKQKSPEYRALSLYLRGRASTQEFRDITAGMTAGNASAGVDGNGGMTISDTVFNDIIEKASNISPVFNLAQHYPSIPGTLEIPRETSAVAGKGFVGELKSVPALTAQLANLKLNPIRVGAFFQLTQSLINNSAIDIVTYAENRVAKDIVRTAARNILIGKIAGETEGFEPIIGGPTEVGTFKLSGAQPTVTDIIKMHASLNNEYIANAAWFVSPAMKQVLETLQNGDGRYLLFDSILGNAANNQVYNLLGAPVYVDDALTGAPSEIVFGDLGAGYALDIQNTMNMVHVTNDTTQALNGGHLVVADAYMDGGVQNPDAIIVGVPGTASAAAGK